jgi:hypothetical protein
MSNAERQRRHRARHGRGPDPTNAQRQAKWRAKQAAKLTAASKPEADPLFASAQTILERQGEADMLRRLRAYWPHMSQPARQALAEGKGFRFWLRED